MSVVKLYSSGTGASAWKLIPSKLFKIDNIAGYLARFSPTTINTFKYVKNGLEISIKVPMTQDKSQPNSSSGIKYVSILNDNENIAYYFVRKAVWRSENTIELELVMDVLNTYTDGTDYIFKENTRILREHKPRFTNPSYVLELEVDETYGQSGIIVANDEVKVYIERQGDWNLVIDNAKVKRLDYGEYVDLILPIGIDIGQIIADFQQAGQYSETIQLRTSDNRYYEFIIYNTARFNVNVMRNIDFISENINPLLIRNENDNEVEDESLLNQDWYLLYRNQNDPSDSLVNPVECYLIPKNSTKTNSGYITGGRLIPSYLEEGKYYYFKVEANATLSNGVSVASSSSRLLLFTRVGNKITATLYYWHSDAYDSYCDFVWYYDDLDFVDFASLPVHYCEYNTPQLINSYSKPSSYPLEFTNSSEENYLDPIELIDRTDAKNIKLIKLPYCPFDFNTSGDTLMIEGDATWDYASLTQANGGIVHCLKLKNLNTKLEHNIDVIDSLNPFLNLNKTIDGISINNPRRTINYKLESKLFHSEFYAPTYVYDSFSLRVELERCQLDYYIDSLACNIKFTMTSTINSKFLFTFTDYKCDKTDQNFPNIIPVARNNEMVLYNVPYINYIRNGFNYDVKAKNLSNASNFIGLGLSGASFVASMALPTVPLKALGVIASAISLVNSVKSTIVETIRNEDTLNQKIMQAQNQTASVSGSDDVDLMSEYCGNRIKYFIYEPSANMKNLINDLFFYAGYNSGRMGVPNHNTRVNFDYLECDASLETAGANIPQEILDEIKNSYKTGVTFIHQTNRNTDKWDMEQKYENWERELLED
ncbi:MAG: hypothetical protein J6S67_01730 [Methanobrevibacter sp.]|nr:hypothetical protein [Methanobrevibacter sp.]